MLYQINKGSKSFGANSVFSDIQFEIKNVEKIAIVGRNGCGKSTLLKCINEEERLDSGTIHKPNNLKIGYLSQKAVEETDKTVSEELNEAFIEIFEIENELKEIAIIMKDDHSDEILNKFASLQNRYEMLNGYSYKSEMMTVFTKFGFNEDDLNRKVNTFSGGQQTRIAFVKLLLSKPDILLLDEPTNHLDLETIKWLEGYLKRYPKAVVLVSHDRMFLDDVVDVVYEIEYGKMSKYVGNYSSYVIQKKNDLERMLIAYNNQQKDIERLEALIERFRYKKTKASFAQSKIKYLERMDRIENPNSPDNKTFKAKFRPKVKGGKTVLTIEDLSVGYDKELCNISLKIHRGDKIAIVGANGTGKSTLLKTLVNLVEPLKGSFLYGHQIEVGYFDQQLAQFDSNKTVLEELWDEYPDLDMTTIRTILGQFLFSADDVFKNVSVLSGGEKVRLSFAKLLLKQANFLILDEPTNHLDIPGKEAFEESLNDYDGTILFVSHDRYFIKQIATSIIEIGENNVEYYPYGYEEYSQKEEIETKEVEVKNVKEKPKPINIKREVKKLENKIQELEELLEEKRSLRFEPEYYHDYKKMNELDSEIDDIHNQIEKLISKWEYLAEYD